MVGEVVVGNSDGSGTHDGVHKPISAVGERAVVDPYMAGTEDRHPIAICHCPPPVVSGRAANHGIASGLAVMDVDSVDDDVGNILDGDTCTISNVDVRATPIYGLEAVHYEFLLEGDHHITLEHDPEWPVLDHCMPKGAWLWVDRIIVAGIGDSVEASIAPTYCIAPEPNTAISQPLAVAVPICVTAPAVVNRIARAAGKKTKVPPLRAVANAPAQSTIYIRTNLIQVIVEYSIHDGQNILKTRT